MIAILCTEGRMKYHEIKEECPSGQWVPIFCYKENSKSIIPIFSDENVALAFVRRNLPKDWVKGAVLLTDRDLEWIKNKGWEIRKMNYPNKLKDLKNIKFDLEILEFEEQPDFFTKRV